MEDSIYFSKLSHAGLAFCGMLDDASPVAPPSIATFADRFLSSVVATEVDINDPRRVVKINEEWFKVAASCGVLREPGREFLLAVRRQQSGESRPRLRWARVELGDSWDIAGESAVLAGLSVKVGHPSFRMLSTDGNSVVQCDVGETSVEIWGASGINGSEPLRQFARSEIEFSDDPVAEAIRRWLNT